MTCEFECAFTCDYATSVHYCCGNPLLCVRRRVAVTVGCEHVPEDLLPNQENRVVDIIFNTHSL